MINPQLLTKENGFEDGVVVELFYQDESGSYTEWDTWVTPDCRIDEQFPIVDLGNTAHDFACLVSIRPLTGPMSIWNHAPEWATHCAETEATIYWYKWGAVPSNTFDIVTARPFWATRSGLGTRL